MAIIYSQKVCASLLFERGMPFDKAIETSVMLVTNPKYHVYTDPKDGQTYTNSNKFFSFCRLKSTRKLFTQNSPQQETAFGKGVLA